MKDLVQQRQEAAILGAGAMGAIAAFLLVLMAAEPRLNTLDAMRIEPADALEVTITMPLTAKKELAR